MTSAGTGGLRILHLIPSFTGGGAERQLTYLASAQADLGNEVHVGYLYDGVNLPRLATTAVHLHRLEAKGNYDPRLCFRVTRLARAVRPSVVQTWLPQMDVLGGLAARFLGVPWVLTERSSALAYPKIVKNHLRSWVARSANAIVANSAVGLEYWAAVSRPLRQVIGNIVPTELIDATPPVEVSSIDALMSAKELIVAAGRFDPAKNWFVMIEALAMVLSRRPEAHAVIFGDGPLRASVRAAVDARTSRIHLMGYTDNLWGWLKSASVYVSSSIFEGAPNVLLEARACGCPVVVSDIPSHRELVDAAHVEFAEVSSPVAFANAIERVLGSPPTRASRVQISATARSKFEPAVVAHQYIELYRCLIGGLPPALTTSHVDRTTSE